MDEGGGTARHFSGVNTRILLDHARSCIGEAGVEAILRDAGEQRPLEVLLDDRTWSSYDEFRRLLTAAARLLEPVGGLDGIADYSSLEQTTAPEVASILQSYGSPTALVEATGSAAAMVYPVLSLDAEILGPTRIRWHRRMQAGFEPFREMCAFFRGMSPHTIRLFGWREVTVVETACQCRGHGSCVIDVTWEETDDLEARLNLTRTALELAQRRLDSFQDTIADIVSADDLDVVLDRIVRHAARALYATGFVLAVDAPHGGTLLSTNGVSRERAQAVLADDTGCTGAEIASTRRRYGRILAVDCNGSAGYEASSLEAYARLAATALDSAFALEDARREAQTANALLELSTSLAELTSSGELAAKVAGAIPQVIDCDCAVVLLLADGVARVAAHHGFPAEVVAEVEGFERHLSADVLLSFNRWTKDDISPYTRSLLDGMGIQALASAPLAVNGEPIGRLVAGVRTGSDRILDDAKLADRFSGLAGQAAVALRNGLLLDQIRHSSLHDSLTALPNRALILDRAEQMLANARRTQTPAAALFLDLDGFKEVNDTLGHGAGDELLQRVAARLQATVRSSDTVGRLGGDEFVILTHGSAVEAGPEGLAERILEVLSEPFQLESRPVAIGASIGIAFGDRPSATELLRDADLALYRAKGAGKNRYCLFAPEMQEEALEGSWSAAWSAWTGLVVG